MRKDKFPETESFHYFNANPKNRIGGDCVIRAISTANNKDWEVTVRELTETGIKYGLVCNDKKCYEKYLAAEGWKKHEQPRKVNNTKYTGAEFAPLCKGAGPIIAHIGGHHLVAIISGKVWDIWDSTDGCIGNYWTR